MPKLSTRALITTVPDSFELPVTDPGVITNRVTKENFLKESEIKDKYESNADTNGFTDAEKTKLNGLVGGHVIQEQGSGLAQRTNLNFVGAAVTAADGGAGPDSSIVTINAEDGAQVNHANTALTNIANIFTKTQSSTVQTLTYAANISWNGSNGNAAEITLTDNGILDNMTDLVAGTIYMLTVKQDATGSRTLTYGSGYNFTDGTPPTLTTSALAKDVLALYSGDGITLDAAILNNPN